MKKSKLPIVQNMCICRYEEEIKRCKQYCLLKEKFICKYKNPTPKIITS